MFCAYNLLNLLQLTRAISEYVPITFQSQKPRLVGERSGNSFAVSYCSGKLL